MAVQTILMLPATARIAHHHFQGWQLAYKPTSKSITLGLDSNFIARHLPPMSNPASQHVINAVAVAAPVVAKAMDLPTAITVVLGLLGIVWYAIQIGEWVRRKLQRVNSNAPAAD